MLDEAYVLYNAPGVPWHKKVELFKLIAAEEQNMFNAKKEKPTDLGKLIRGLTTKELREAVATSEEVQ